MLHNSDEQTYPTSIQPQIEPGTLTNIEATARLCRGQQESKTVNTNFADM